MSQSKGANNTNKLADNSPLTQKADRYLPVNFLSYSNNNEIAYVFV